MHKTSKPLLTERINQDRGQGSISPSARGDGFDITYPDGSVDWAATDRRPALHIDWSSSLKTQGLDVTARQLTEARKAIKDALEAARIAAIDAVSKGMSEVGAANALGVNRLTVRKWLGKDN